jgi:hypothetical protein
MSSVGGKLLEGLGSMVIGKDCNNPRRGSRGWMVPCPRPPWLPPIVLFFES